MIVLNGLNKVSMTEIMKEPERVLVSEYSNSGFTVREYLVKGLLFDTTVITEQLDGEAEESYTPSSDMSDYAIERWLKSKNTETLAQIYYDLLV